VTNTKQKNVQTNGEILQNGQMCFLKLAMK